VPPLDGTHPDIDQYALLSDTHTAALVGPDGAVEWMCVPTFDSGSVFASLLDRGRCSGWPAAGPARTTGARQLGRGLAS
jgi:GH15 family glucan-1,4-alpha-glucosidase